MYINNYIDENVEVSTMTASNKDPINYLVIRHLKFYGD